MTAGAIMAAAIGALIPGLLLVLVFRIFRKDPAKAERKRSEQAAALAEEQRAAERRLEESLRPPP